MHEPDGDADPNPDFGLRGCKATGWRMVDQLDGADLDHAMAAQRIKASCLGIDDDFSHKKSPVCPTSQNDCSPAVYDVCCMEIRP